MDHPPPPSPPPSRFTPNPRVVATAAAAARPAPRRYPKPPPFIRRTLQFCFKPESWASAARYPTHITFIPLLVVILVGNMIAATSQTLRQFQLLAAFQATYDKTYPPMELSSEGVLSVKGELKSPVRIPLLYGAIVVDPTGRTDPQTLSWGASTAAFVSDREIYFAKGPLDEYGFQPLMHEPFGALPPGLIHLPAQGQVKQIDGAAIQQFLWSRSPVFVMLGLLWGVAMALGEALWAAMVIVLLSPLIMMVASVRRENEDGTRGKFVLLPRRAAVRMAAALTVPLTLASALLRGGGITPAMTMGPVASTMLWMVAAVALSIWTAIIARQMFGSLKPAK